MSARLRVTSAPTTVARPADPQTPWQSWSWLLGAVWVIFLCFPITWIAGDDDVALGWRVGGIIALLLFAAVYAWGIYRIDHPPAAVTRARVGVEHLAALLALSLAPTALLGPDALMLLGFGVVLALLALPLVVGLAVWAVFVLIATLVPMVGDYPGLNPMPAVLVAIGVFVLLIRYIETRDAEHHAVAEEHQLTQERDRVARDVHDVLGHSLTVVTVKLELAERLVDLDPEAAKAQLAQARSMTRESLAEIRATVAGLRVARLSDERQRAVEALDSAQIEAVVAETADTVDPRHRIVLAWALRELVTNVVRHSAARQCTIEWGPDWLSVTDDGVGMSGTSEGNGLRGLRERVHAAGGTITAAIGPTGAGTTVRVHL